MSAENLISGKAEKYKEIRTRSWAAGRYTHPVVTSDGTYSARLAWDQGGLYIQLQKLNMNGEWVDEPGSWAVPHILMALMAAK